MHTKRILIKKLRERKKRSFITIEDLYSSYNEEQYILKLESAEQFKKVSALIQDGEINLN